jgi:hypothetical protein
MIGITIEKRLAGPDGPLIVKLNSTIQRGELVALYGPTERGNQVCSA